jgi:small multidrug resistance family-3 protein
VNDVMSVVRSLALFSVAGVCEIGGGWLVWKSLRDGRPAWWGLAGAVVLILYGIIPTLQASHFGRIYAVYGGFFIVLSLFWGWLFDGNLPDRPDVIGGAIALAGVCLMMYWPRPEPAKAGTAEQAAVAPFDVAGRTQPVLGRVGLISPLVGHPVRQVLVAPGDRVKAGQPLVRLGTDDSELRGREAALAEAQARLVRTRARPSEEELAGARAGLERARSATREAHQQLERLEPLWQKGEVAEPAYRKARSALAVAEAEERVAAARLERLQQQPVGVAVAEMEARVAAARAAVDAARAEVEQVLVRAPIGGVVTWLAVQPGATAAPGAPGWGEILDLGELDVRCELTPRQADAVAAGDAAQVTQEGVPNGRRPLPPDGGGPGDLGRRTPRLPPAAADGLGARLLHR